MYRKKKRLSAAILTAATVLCLSSAAVLAARKHFSPSDAAEELNDTKLADAFLNDRSIRIDETQSLEIVDIGVNSGNIAIDTAEPSSIVIRGNSEQGIAVAEYAIQFLGTPYQWGEDSLTEGTDCSGFVKSIYEHFGISLPHSAASDRSEGSGVESLEDAEPGDLICYEEPSHVALYIGGGKIIHASPTAGVCISNVEYAEYARITAIRRILEEQE